MSFLKQLGCAIESQTICGGIKAIKPTELTKKKDQQLILTVSPIPASDNSRALTPNDKQLPPNSNLPVAIKSVSKPNQIWVDTPEQMVEVIVRLKQVEKNATNVDVFADGEGHPYDQYGVLSVIQLRIESQDIDIAIDVITLGGTIVFDSAPEGCFTFRQFLEDPAYLIGWFDARNDSAVLHGQYGIRMQGVVDVQLMEFGSKSYWAERLFSLSDCISLLRGQPNGITHEEWIAFDKGKTAGTNWCRGPRGYKVLLDRPIASISKEYAWGDVHHLGDAYSFFKERVAKDPNPELMTKIIEESKARIVESTAKGYQACGRDKVFGPQSLRKPMPDPYDDFWDDY